MVIFAGGITINVDKQNMTPKIAGTQCCTPSTHDQDHKNKVLVQVSQRTEDKETKMEMDTFVVKVWGKDEVFILRGLHEDGNWR